MRHRRAASAAFHALAAGAALASAFLLRFEFMLDARYGRMLLVALPVAIAVKLAVFRGYRAARFAVALYRIGRRHSYGGGERRGESHGGGAAAMAMGLWLSAVDLRVGLPAVPGIHDRSAAAGPFAFRAKPRAVGSRRILIYGAGRAGVTLLSEIREHPELGYQVAGFLDDDPLKRDLRLRGVRVWGGRAMLAEAVRRERIGEDPIGAAGGAGGGDRSDS